MEQKTKKDKLPGESFSETIRREVKPKTDLMDLCGVWDEKTAKDVERHIKESRKQSRKRTEWLRKQFA